MSSILRCLVVIVPSSVMGPRLLSSDLLKLQHADFTLDTSPATWPGIVVICGLGLDMFLTSVAGRIFQDSSKRPLRS